MPPGLETQMPVGLMPVERATDYRPETLDRMTRDHRYNLGVTSLLLTQRARVRSPVGPDPGYFRSFPSTVKQMSGNLGHIRRRLSYGHHISSILKIHMEQ